MSATAASTPKPASADGALHRQLINPADYDLIGYAGWVTSALLHLAASDSPAGKRLRASRDKGGWALLARSFGLGDASGAALAAASRAFELSGEPYDNLMEWLDRTGLFARIADCGVDDWIDGYRRDPKADA